MPGIGLSTFGVAIDDSFVRVALAGLLVVFAIIGFWCLRQQGN